MPDFPVFFLVPFVPWWLKLTLEISSDLNHQQAASPDIAVVCAAQYFKAAIGKYTAYILCFNERTAVEVRQVCHTQQAGALLLHRKRIFLTPNQNLHPGWRMINAMAL